ncbi:MAG: dihydroorotase [Pseudorhodoplanes sp.]
MNRITIRRPDDWHVHFRSGAMLKTVVPFTARQFGRAIVMPNLVPPVTTAKMAAAYREEIRAAVPRGADFTPLMTCYLTDDTDPADLVDGNRKGIFTAAKLYPAHATTNAQHGVTDIAKIHRVLGAMEEHGIPLLTHGEVTDAAIDVFDREKVFIERVLEPTLERFPGLKIVMEHITTSHGAEIVRRNKTRMGATITPQHLLFNRNALFQGGLRPHMYCLPILKREEHRRALRSAATGGETCFFLGTDTAPHLRHLKEADCGCAGVFSAPVAIEAYLSVFSEENAIDRFEGFASLHGPAFYGLPPNENRVTFARKSADVPKKFAVSEEGELICLFAGGQVDWSAVREDKGSVA